MYPIVAKFGGTSLADAAQFRKVAAIIQADPSRRFVVVSAPGKRHRDDLKITDLLLGCMLATGRKTNIPIIRERFEQIDCGLGTGINFEDTFRFLEHDARTTGDFASRGEYLSARIMAAFLGARFVDAAEFVSFREDGTLDMSETRRRAASFIRSDTRIVVPGFYGALPNGQIKTFSRGGSDITGSLVAALVQARVYENWTDVPGILTADPRIVRSAHPIPELFRSEVRELSLRGADVLHPSAMEPLHMTEVIVHVRSTNDPGHPGTMIVPYGTHLERAPGSIVGIAGRKNFVTFTIAKYAIDEEVGFIELAGRVFREYGLPITRIVDGADSVSITVHSSILAGKRELVVNALRSACHAETVEVADELAIVSVVGTAMAHVPGVLAKAAAAIAESGVSVRSISQDPNERSIMFVVNNRDYEASVRALHQAFHP